MDGIWIDRDGARYGPYTPDEFLAYLASGHIVAGDRARVGERGGFEPVPVVAAWIAGRPPSVDAPPKPVAETGQEARADMPSASGGTLPPPAGFWRRAGAWAIDVGIVLGAWTLLGLAASLALIALTQGAGAGWLNSTALGSALGLAGTAALFLGWAAYCAWQESSPAQATLGKRLMGLVVVDEEGGRITIERALGRHVAALANWLTFGIGWLLAAGPPGKRGLHDRLAGTCVVCDGERAVSPWLGAAAVFGVGALLLAGRIVLQRGFVLAF